MKKQILSRWKGFRCLALHKKTVLAVIFRDLVGAFKVIVQRHCVFFHFQIFLFTETSNEKKYFSQ